jgi:hypothetical protein
VRVAYGGIGGWGTSVFSKAHLNKDDPPKTEQWPVPDVDTDGNKLLNMAQAFYISPGKWIRASNTNPDLPTFPEIYVSQDNGEKWRKKANVDLEWEGVFTVAGSSSNPIIYAPFRGTRTRPDGSKRVGLIRFTDVFTSTVDNYDEDDLIYLNVDEGSLGSRFTEFDWQTVYGVDPNNPDYIIAPDIYNDRIMVSRNGGDTWNIDNNLTREVTKSRKILLYDEHPKRMQVTRISFDPYNRNNIYVGTRDVGVILSTDGGKTWSTLPDTNRILYITNFFFMPSGNTVVVSSYGRGLWKIHFGVYLRPFPEGPFCRGGRCIFRLLPDLEIHYPPYPPIDWLDKDVIIFLNGRINGLILSGTEIKTITVTPGTTFKRYIGKTKDFRELHIVESKQGEGFDGLKGRHTALENDEIFKGVILKENEIIGIISGKEAFKEEENKVVEDLGIISTKEKEFSEVKNKPNYKPKSKNSSNIRTKKPYLFIGTSIPIMGIPVVGRDRNVNLFAKGFTFHPERNNNVKIMIGSQVINKNAKVIQGGNVRYQLKVSQELSNGEHIVKVVQKVNRKDITASGSFIIAQIDDFDENRETTNS